METAEVKITILVDDSGGVDNLAGEHGFSCWIEKGANKLLFDTGKSDLFLKNAGHLGIDPFKAHRVVLSHGHYDHTGGLKYLLGQNSDLNVYACPEAFHPKYTQDPDGKIRYIGIPISKADIEKQARVIPLTGPTPIMDNIFATGPVPRLTPFEDTGGKFYTDERCTSPDLLPDDQSLFWESSQGMVILLGCAHSGVINIIRYVRQITCNKPIYAILGGMHLLNASKARLKATVEALREYDVNLVGPAHCTGLSAINYFQANLSDRLKTFRTGSSTVFE